jgi:hypothetical protein
MKGKITNLVFYHQPGLTSGYKRFPLPFLSLLLRRRGKRRKRMKSVCKSLGFSSIIFHLQES